MLPDNDDYDPEEIDEQFDPLFDDYAFGVEDDVISEEDLNLSDPD